MHTQIWEGQKYIKSDAEIFSFHYIKKPRYHLVKMVSDLCPYYKFNKYFTLLTSKKHFMRIY